MLTVTRRHASGAPIEGAGGYGRGLADHLIDEGERGIEIDRPKRPDRRNGEKTDVLDATRAARECLARGEITDEGSVWPHSVDRFWIAFAMVFDRM